MRTTKLYTAKDPVNMAVLTLTECMEIHAEYLENWEVIEDISGHPTNTLLSFEEWMEEELEELEES